MFHASRPSAERNTRCCLDVNSGVPHAHQRVFAASLTVFDVVSLVLVGVPSATLSDHTFLYYIKDDTSWFVHDRHDRVTGTQNNLFYEYIITVL